MVEDFGGVIHHIRMLKGQWLLLLKDTTNYHGILVNGSSAPNVCFDRSTGTTPEWKVGISGNVGENFSISKGTANDDKLMITSAGQTLINTTDGNMPTAGGNAPCVIYGGA